VSGFTGFPLLGAYSGTKFAVKAVTGALRMEEKPMGVQVTEVNPGMIRTDILNASRLAEAYQNGKSSIPQAYQEYEKMVRKMMKRAPLPKEVAEVVWKTLMEVRTERHYFVNRDSRWMLMAKWLLPTSTWEWIISRSFSWCKNPNHSTIAQVRNRSKTKTVTLL
jgi:short-subunit dehydrogenase